MSGGVLFVVCIPTESAERKLLGDPVAVDPQPATTTAGAEPLPNGGPPPKSPRLGVDVAPGARNSFAAAQSPLVRNALHVADERNLVRMWGAVVLVVGAL